MRNLIKKNGLENRVKLAGHLQSPWPHYAKADCFLVPSRWEGLPNVVLESLACGTPVIATSQAGGIQEIQKRAGFDHVCIVSNIIALIDEMKKIQPQPCPVFRSSLLPKCYEKEVIVEEFSKLLCQGLENNKKVVILNGVDSSDPNHQHSVYK